MAENPLLPNAELRALYKLLTRAEALVDSTAKPRRPRQTRASSASSPATGREALLAGTLLQLRPGDLLATESQDPVPAALLSGDTSSKAGSQPSVLSFGSGSANLLLAAGLASALKRLGGDRVVLAFFQAGSLEPQWAEALKWAQTEILPLIIACADSSGPDAFRPTPDTAPGALNWSTVQKPASRLKFPILSVDGEDAVAVYRVMQESVLRARSGGGPAMLWAVLRSEAKGARRKQDLPATPLQRLEHYLKSRKISLA